MLADPDSADAVVTPPARAKPLRAAPRATGLPELLTAEEVAAWLKISVKAVYARAERGALPGATRLGRCLRFVRADLLRFLEQGRVPYLGESSGGT